ncbi:MAG TPA: hypothetical protein VEC11_16335 [Allosphingosinicella sp.]|nr:hypothetical protein [Allosphingosinicella sp.]
MQITEKMLAPVRRQFGDADGALPVRRLEDFYNEAIHNILPLFDERKPLDFWKHHVRAHGMRPTGERIFSYIDWPDAAGQGVALLLAFVDRVPRLSDRYRWQALAHCHGGVGLDYLNLIGTALTPRPDMVGQLQAIADRWSGSILCDSTQAMPQLRVEAKARLAEYRAQLAALGVRWTGAAPSPRDALYPIDATQEALDRLAVDPPLLWAVSQSETVAPVILLLSENSD